MTSCSKPDIAPPNSFNKYVANDANKSENNAGEAYFESIKYLQSFAYVNDQSMYDPLIYRETGQKVYDFHRKVVTRLDYFYDSIGFSIDTVGLINATKYYSGLTPNNLIAGGANAREVGYNLQMAGSFVNDTTLSLLTLKSNLDVLKSAYQNDGQLPNSSKVRLDFNLNLTNALIDEAIANGGLVVGDIDDYAGIALGCGGAAVAYSFAFVGLCMATGPIGWAVGIGSFAFAVNEVIEEC